MVTTSLPNNRRMVMQGSGYPLGDTLLSHLNYIHDKLPIPSKNDNVLMLILPTYLWWVIKMAKNSSAYTRALTI